MCFELPQEKNHAGQSLAHLLDKLFPTSTSGQSLNPSSFTALSELSTGLRLRVHTCVLVLFSRRLFTVNHSFVFLRTLTATYIACCKVFPLGVSVVSSANRRQGYSTIP